MRKTTTSVDYFRHLGETFFHTYSLRYLGPGPTTHSKTETDDPDDPRTTVHRTISVS